MKKTFFLLVLGMAGLFVTSCSRGYGCPYTMETKNSKTEQQVQASELAAEEVDIQESTNMTD